MSLNNKLEISCEAFASFFAEKILRLHQDFSAEFGADSEVEAPRLSCGPIFDRFNLCSLADVDKALKAVRPTTRLLDPCPSWLVKVGQLPESCLHQPKRADRSSLKSDLETIKGPSVHFLYSFSGGATRFSLQKSSQKPHS